MEQRDPHVVSVDLSRGMIFGQGEEPVKLGEVQISIWHRLRFLMTGTIEFYQLDNGGHRVSIQAPQFRSLPLRLMDRFWRGNGDRT